MPGYWIETEYFAAPTGDLTPEQYALFWQFCQSEAECNEFFIWDKYPIPTFSDWSQTWEKHKSDTGSEKIIDFWKAIKNNKPLPDRHSPSWKTLINIFPDDAIITSRKFAELPPDFSKKWHRFLKIKVYENRCQSNPAFQKDIVAKDWDLLNDLLKWVETACENHSGKQKSQGKPVAVKMKSIDKLRIAVYEGILMANDTELVERWHILSKTKYGGRGWAEIAQAVLESEQKKTGRVKEISSADRDKKATEIRRAVNKFRNHLQGIDVEDQNDWDFL